MNHQFMNFFLSQMGKKDTFKPLQQAGLRRRLTTKVVYSSCFTLTLENSCCIGLFNTWSGDGAAVSAVIKE
ncbi:hypothetical protein BpHYR1_009439 [Brachionus plicatilis]|uniref:Uncharacterized protein n=1 Tax=Brachionus plicatilis TaxID=10195 RepID=A0A3M7QQS3_BRAPC|nr:hypothetical protein BpHYR1_009439 [Brachionus plicatilis]